jgi:hypothetical protein
MIAAYATDRRSSPLSRGQRVKQLAWGVACGLMLLAAAQGSARAQDDDDNQNSIWNLDTRIYQGFMSSLGLKNGSEKSIEYHERSPLVLPPTRDLPPPEAAHATPGPAWPVDPDQKRRKEAAVAKAKRKAYDPDEEARNLTPSELNRGTTGAVPGARPGRNGNDDPEGSNLAPSSLGYFGGLFGKGLGFGMPGAPKDEVGTFTKEPTREALTAPPPGYQTPSPAAPYGVTKRTGYGPTAKPDLAVGQLGN